MSDHAADGPHTGRLFIALWPGPQARAATLAHRDAWAWSDAARPMRPDQFHLTLHFLGALPQRLLPALREGLAVPFTAFDITLAQTNVWRGGIAVIEPAVLPPALLALHAALGDALHRLGLPTDSRPYRPHVTLARQGDGAVPPAEVAPLRWRARSYALAESVAGPPRRYRLLQRYR